MKEPQKITSRENDRLKFAKRVRDGKEDRLIFIEGPRLAEEAIAARINPVCAFAASVFLAKPEARPIVEHLEQSAVDVFELPESLFALIADTKTPQGIILIAERPEPEADGFEAVLRQRNGGIPVLVYLHEVNNPANLGAVARAAEAAGAAGMIISPNSASAFSPKAIRGSMGSLLRLPVWEGKPLDSIIGWCRENGVRARATYLEGSVSYLDVDWTMPSLLVFGSEGHGLPDDAAAEFDQLVRIPMQESVESLNLAVSSGIILFEARRQAMSKG